MDKIKTIKHNNNYNIVQLQRNNVFDYYIEKIGYGDLKHIFGCYKDFKTFNKEYIDISIKIAEEENFW